MTGQEISPARWAAAAALIVAIFVGTYTAAKMYTQFEADQYEQVTAALETTYGATDVLYPQGFSGSTPAANKTLTDVTLVINGTTQQCVVYVGDTLTQVSAACPDGPPPTVNASKS